MYRSDQERQTNLQGRDRATRRGHPTQHQSRYACPTRRCNASMEVFADAPSPTCCRFPRSRSSYSACRQGQALPHAEAPLRTGDKHVCLSRNTPSIDKMYRYPDRRMCASQARHKGAAAEMKARPPGRHSWRTVGLEQWQVPITPRIPSCRTSTRRLRRCASPLGFALKGWAGRFSG